MRRGIEDAARLAEPARRLQAARSLRNRAALANIGAARQPMESDMELSEHDDLPAIRRRLADLETQYLRMLMKHEAALFISASILAELATMNPDADAYLSKLMDKISIRMTERSEGLTGIEVDGQIKVFECAAEKLRQNIDWILERPDDGR